MSARSRSRSPWLPTPGMVAVPMRQGVLLCAPADGYVLRENGFANGFSTGGGGGGGADIGGGAMTNGGGDDGSQRDLDSLLAEWSGGAPVGFWCRACGATTWSGVDGGGGDGGESQPVRSGGATRGDGGESDVRSLSAGMIPPPDGWYPRHVIGGGGAGAPVGFWCRACGYGGTSLSGSSTSSTRSAATSDTGSLYVGSVADTEASLPLSVAVAEASTAAAMDVAAPHPLRRLWTQVAERRAAAAVAAAENDRLFDPWSWNTSSCWGSWHSEPWHNGTRSWNTRSVWDVTETQPSERWTEMHHYNYCGQSCPCCRSINPEDVMGTCKICDAGLQEIKSGHAKQNLAFQHDELLD